MMKLAGFVGRCRAAALPLAGLAVLAQACSSDDEGGGALAPQMPEPSVWAARADSVRGLDNPAGVDYRLYVEDAGLEVGTGRINARVTWRNDGPAAVDGAHALVLRVAGPADRTITLGGVDLDGLGVGDSRITVLTRGVPPDVGAGTYEASLQLVRESAPAGPVDVALQPAFIDVERRWGVGALRVE